MLDMGIIKVEVNFGELKKTFRELKAKRTSFFEMLSTEIKGAASRAITQVLDGEIAIFLGKSENNKRNDYNVKQYAINSWPPRPRNLSAMVVDGGKVADKWGCRFIRHIDNGGKVADK